MSKKVNLFFRRIDHSMIFVLIAGSYTPVCLLALDKKQVEFHCSFSYGLLRSSALL
ncbi:MAG: hemolysin III family protein [Anaerobutyricum hallii]